MTIVHRRFVSPCALVLLITLIAWLASAVYADPTPGFVEHWAGVALSGWGGGDFYSNPGAGGQLGAGDGYLTFTTPGPDPFFSLNLGTTNASPSYTGNWVTAGITQVKFWLNDIGNPDALEMHFAVGNNSNFWQYDTGFIPPAGSWAQFTVDVTSAAGWTRIIGSGPSATYANALSSVGRILIRHDHAPYVQPPDEITADVGVDELTLFPVPDTDVPFAGSAALRPVELAPPYPNPSRGPVVLAMQSFDGSPIRIEVVDVAGRLVRHAGLDAAAAGSRLWTWDGRTDAGVTAPAGYYRVRAIGDAGGTSRPLMRLKASF